MKSRFYPTHDHRDYIEFGKKSFKLNTSYDNILLLLDVMKDDEVVNKPEAFFEIIIYNKDWNDFIEIANNKSDRQELTNLISYITKNVLFFDGENKKPTKKIMDLYQDMELVFASFYYDYKISLIEKKGKMTWAEFLILLENISPKSPLGRVMELRNMNPNDYKDPKTKNKIKAAKRRVALSKSDDEIKNREKGLFNLLSKVSKKSK
jgi:hypothetical protein